MNLNKQIEKKRTTLLGDSFVLQLNYSEASGFLVLVPNEFGNVLRIQNTGANFSGTSKNLKLTQTKCAVLILRRDLTSLSPFRQGCAIGSSSIR